MNATNVHVLSQYIVNNSTNSTTDIDWPKAIENNDHNVTLCDNIIKECKITDSPVNLTLINSTPGLFLSHMYNFLLYSEEYNQNAAMNQQEIQTEITYSWVKDKLANSTVLKKMHAKKLKGLTFSVFKSILNNTPFVNKFALEENELVYITDIIVQTTRRIQNSKLFLDRNNSSTVQIEDCFRPGLTSTVKKAQALHLSTYLFFY